MICYVKKIEEYGVVIIIIIGINKIEERRIKFHHAHSSTNWETLLKGKNFSPCIVYYVPLYTHTLTYTHIYISGNCCCYAHADLVPKRSITNHPKPHITNEVDSAVAGFILLFRGLRYVSTSSSNIYTIFVNYT